MIVTQGKLLRKLILTRKSWFAQADPRWTKSHRKLGGAHRCRRMKTDHWCLELNSQEIANIVWAFTHKKLHPSSCTQALRCSGTGSSGTRLCDFIPWAFDSHTIASRKTKNQKNCFSQNDFFKDWFFQNRLSPRSIMP